MDKAKLKNVVNGLLYVGIGLWLLMMNFDKDFKIVSIYSMIVAIAYLVLWRVKPYSSKEGKSPVELFEQLSVVFLFVAIIIWIIGRFF
ncbi:MAG: hypothetical protein GXZ08_01655 [Tissierellia bacterium]|nr:hypothetical protein [Tissierellia bacterium]